MNGRKSFGSSGGSGGRGRAGAAGAQGKDGQQRRPMFRRRKVCKFCSDKIDDINYKDVKLLSPFVPERGKILPRRISGTCATHQRKLQTAIKADRARAKRTEESRRRRVARGLPPDRQPGEGPQGDNEDDSGDMMFDGADMEA